MADYQQLLKRAIDSLPENNGANRRQVYEKARTALVTQLRAVEPALSAGDITQHRLSLEDCIREVEQHAIQSLMDGMRPSPAPSPHDRDDAPVGPRVSAGVAAHAEDVSAAPSEDVVADIIEEAGDDEVAKDSSDDQMADEAVGEEPVAGDDRDDDEADLAAAVAQSQVSDDVDDAADNADDEEAEESLSEFVVDESDDDDSDADDSVDAEPDVADEPDENDEPDAEDRADALSEIEQLQAKYPDVDASSSEEKVADAPSVDAPSVGDNAEASGDVPEVEGPKIAGAGADAGKEDPQEAIDRAIAKLTHIGDDAPEVKSDKAPEGDEAVAGVDKALDAAIDSVTSGAGVSGSNDPGVMRDVAAPEKSSGALRILFLTILLLLAIFAGAIYWAWDTGRVDLSNMLDRVSLWRASITQMVAGDDADSEDGTSEVASEAADNPATSDTEVVDPAPNDESDPEIVIENGSGNESDTVEPATNVRVIENDEPEAADSGDAVIENGSVAGDDQKSEDRLPSSGAGSGAGDEASAENSDGTAVNSDIPVSQSILLEEQASGSTGGLPFSGNVVWDRIEDSAGVPAIRATAKIPARNIGLELVIRKNFDDQLPASHVMEINFTVQPTFAGGGVANVPGILLKNEELAQGKALIGASARVLDNSFLVALSQAEADLTHNLALMLEQAWIDVPMVYSTGKRAIITLEKGVDGNAIFAEVMAEWTKSD